jgi:hypothetical protein
MLTLPDVARISEIDAIVVKTIATPLHHDFRPRRHPAARTLNSDLPPPPGREAARSHTVPRNCHIGIAF